VIAQPPAIVREPMARIDPLRRDWTLWFFPLVYVIAAWRIYGNLGLLDNSRIVGGPWSDPVQQAWFLEYWKWAVLHAHFSAWTNLMDHPLGFDLFDNPSLPLVAIPSIPLTALFGPVATLGLLFRLAFFLSALSGFLVLRRVLATPVAAGLGGLMYAFGPSQVAWGQNWLHFTFVPLPPMMLYLIYRGVTDPAHARRHGVRLGVVTIAEALIDPEFAVEALIVAGLTLGVLLIARRTKRNVSSRDFVGFFRTGVGFATVAIVPLALLSWLILYGRAAYRGGLFALHSSGYSPVDLLLPNANNYVSSLFGLHLPDYTVGARNGTYVGIPLIIAFAVITVRLRRQPLVRATAVMTVIAWVLTLGNYLSTQNGTVTSIPLPFSVINRLPVGASIDGTRFTLLLDLGVAVVLAAGIDALIRSARWLGARIAFAGVIAFGVALAAPVSALSAASVAPFAPFEAASRPIERVIPRGGVVLTLPYSNGGPIESMLWQTMAGMRFDIMGGYAMRQAPPGYPAFGYPELAQTTVDCLLMAGPAKNRGAPCQSLRVARRRLRAFVRQWQVSAILVQIQPREGDTIKLLNSLYETRDHDGSIYVWATGVKST
jgi:hypothetical protein